MEPNGRLEVYVKKVKDEMEKKRSNWEAARRRNRVEMKHLFTFVGRQGNPGPGQRYRRKLSM